MDLTEIGRGVTHLFNDSKFSDVNIKLDDGSEIFAHKMVLHQGSSHFRTLLENEHLSEFAMRGDAHAARGIIAYMYGREYDPVAGTTRIPSPSDKPLTGSAHASYQVELFLLAHAFVLPSLRLRTFQRFEEAIEIISQSVGYPKELDKLVRLVWITYRVGAAELRPTVVKRLVKILPFIKNDLSLESLLNDVPSLGYELLKSTVAAPVGFQPGPTVSSPFSHPKVTSTTTKAFGVKTERAHSVSAATLAPFAPSIKPNSEPSKPALGSSQAQTMNSSPQNDLPSAPKPNFTFGSGLKPGSPSAWPSKPMSNKGFGYPSSSPSGNLVSSLGAPPNTITAAAAAPGMKRKACEIEETSSFAQTAPALGGPQETGLPKVKIPRTS